MKKIALIVVVFAFVFPAFSQNTMRERIEEKVKIQQIAFITQRLSLTETEAQQFWPIFNEYTEKLQVIRKQPKLEKPADELDDVDVEKNILAQFDRESRELDLKKAYFPKLKTVISAKKIVKLYRAERDFRKELVNQLQEMRENEKKAKKRNRE